MKLLFSIVTVCFNAEHTIEETIKSVIGQTCHNFEYLIIDGASKDNTLKIVNKYKKFGLRVISEPDKGLYDAMNKGVKLAKGKYVLFLNADDVFCNDKVLSNVEKEADNNYDLIFGDIEFFYPSEKTTLRISREASVNELKAGNMPPHQGSFVKRALLVNKPFDIKFKSSADFDFFCKLLLSKPAIKKIPILIAQVASGGISSGKVSYRETEEIVLSYFGWGPYLKLIFKHNVFSFFRSILLRSNLLKYFHILKKKL